MFVGLVLLGCVAQTTTAAVVYLKGNKKPIYGFIESRTKNQLLMRVYQDGTLKNVVVPLNEVLLELQTVSTERLEKLDPSKLTDYRDYAEELAIKRVDPESRETAIRLFLIVAEHDKADLRTSAMKWLIALSRSNKEKRQFQALAFRLGVFKQLSNTQKGGSVAGVNFSQKRRMELVEIIRNWRSLKTNTTLEKADLEDYKTLLAGDDLGISYSDFATTIQKKQIESIDVARLLPIELKLRSLQEEPESPTQVAWKKLLASGENKPVSRITLAKATEFDPAQRYFRKGAWVANEN